MPKTTAPLLSFDARGQIGKTQVYSSWKGVAYARRYVVPANPKTEKQMSNRAVFQMLNQAWLYAPAAIREAFNSYAVGKPLTGRNKFFSDNQRLLGTDPKPTDIEGFVMSPGSRGGLPATDLVIVPGDGQLTVSATLPAAPSGWQIDAVIAAAIPNIAPTDPFGGAWYVVVDDETPYSTVITGLENAQEYAVGYFIKWIRPDGKEAYSISLSGTGTPAA